MSTNTRVTSAGTFRPELHGLRAIAILMVASYHIWIGRVSGGIDIFLLISSYLLMQTFLRRMDNGRKLDVVGYWLKAFRRLLPPAVITILASVGVAYAFFAPELIREVLRQAVASLGYYENWYLAENGFDYYADKSVVSPLQHFWSLSIQGQIFLVWPAIIAVCWWAAKRSKTNVRTWLAVVFGAIFATSLAWSIFQTATLQQYAYFSTWTRLWEFALGALFALVLPKIETRFKYGPGIENNHSRLQLTARFILGWAGLIAVLSCGLIIDVQGLFPGYVALWPTMAALIVLVAGNTGLPFSADRLLSSRPLQFLGDKSYALYLVHWPVLITALHLTGRDQLRLSQGVFALGISIALAVVLTDWVDAPIRYSTWAAKRYLNSALVIIISLVVGFVPVLSYESRLIYKERQLRLEAIRNNPGALTLTGEELPSPDANPPTLSLLENIREDWAFLPNGCPGRASFDREWEGSGSCYASHFPGQKLVVAVGNSRLEQYLPFLETLGKDYNWYLVNLLMGGCGYYRSDDFWMPGGQNCVDWNRQVDDYIDHVKPDMVILLSTYIGYQEGEIMTPGLSEILADYTSRGIDVLALRDEPRLPRDPISCLNDLRVDDPAISDNDINENCAVSRYEAGFRDIDELTEIANNTPGPGQVFLVDPSIWICPDEQCPIIIGNVHVYIDSNHITAMYANTMTEPIRPQLDEFFA